MERSVGVWNTILWGLNLPHAEINSDMLDWGVEAIDNINDSPRLRKQKPDNGEMTALKRGLLQSSANQFVEFKVNHCPSSTVTTNSVVCECQTRFGPHWTPRAFFVHLTVCMVERWVDDQVWFRMAPVGAPAVTWLPTHSRHSIYDIFQWSLSL